MHQLHPGLAREGGQHVVADTGDPAGTHLGRGTVEFFGPHPAADTVPGFQDLHVETGIDQLARAGQAGGAGTDHDDARTRWSGPGQLRGRPAAREQRSVDICGRPG